MSSTASPFYQNHKQKVSKDYIWYRRIYLFPILANYYIVLYQNQIVIKHYRGVFLILILLLVIIVQ